MSFLRQLLSLSDGEDYVPANLGVVFSANIPISQEVCFPVTIIDDIIVEGEEFFYISIMSASQEVTIGAPNVTIVIITDNDGKDVRRPINHMVLTSPFISH